MEPEMESVSFWAKTGAGKFGQDGRPEYHPVICHLADTAAVAMEIVENYLSPVAISTNESRNYKGSEQ
jgi:CRISPR-associated endonuclease/helicase Cas3